MSIVQAVHEVIHIMRLNQTEGKPLLHKTEFFQIQDEKLFLGVFLQWISTVTFPFFPLFAFFLLLQSVNLMHWENFLKKIFEMLSMNSL